MDFGAYSFHCKLEDDGFLPPYKGSTFRGAFGHALKSVVCALRRESCTSCLLRDQCVYSLVFETPLSQEMANRPVAPKPFVIEPPHSSVTRMKKGDSFDFKLLLFGEANNYLPYFVYAFKKMGTDGIGAKKEGKRSKYLIQRVTCNGSTIYEPETDRLELPKTERLCIEASGTDSESKSQICVNFLTPVRLKSSNSFQRDLSFEILMRASLRRLSDLCNYWGKGEPSLDYGGMVYRSKSIQAINSDIRWVGLKRRSSRQNQLLSLSGLVGKIVYKGALDEFIPVLRFCEKTHIGKATVFGLGKFQIT